MPLEVILDSYLGMVDEGKVSIVRDFSYEINSDNEDDDDPWIEEPWMMNPYSQTDVSKAVAVLRRLITAIEARMQVEETTITVGSEIHLPWHNPVTLNQAFLPPDSFVSF
jgi:hypothetical protein